MSTKTLLMLVGEQVEVCAAMAHFQMQLMVGYRAHAVCPGRRVGETVPTAVHDFEGDQTQSEKPGRPDWVRAFLAVLGTRIEP